MDHSKNSLELCLITGFLGAGKTTLLRKVLECNLSEPYALFVNDFGEVGIDSKLLQLSSKSEVLEFSNGCVCCVLSSDLLSSIRNHVKKYPKIKRIFFRTQWRFKPRTNNEGDFFHAREFLNSYKISAHSVCD